jgi:hypothetical protein
MASASSVDHPPGEDEVERAAEADDPRQPLGAAVDERDAPPALGEAERRALGGDPQVAPQGELEAAGQAPAADGGDRRLRRRAPREAQRAARVAQARGEGLDRLEVGAGAEAHAAGAGEDQRPRRVVGLEGLHAGGQTLGRGSVDGVAAVLTVDGQHGGGADPLVVHLVGHRRGPYKHERPGQGAPGRA